MLRTTDFAHLVLRQTLKPGDIAVDTTIGNGHDTAFLADCVGPTGHIYGFDVQQAALSKTAERVAGRSNVTLIHCGHEHLTARLPSDAHGRVAAVMFNLGYLPGADKQLTTTATTTVTALTQAVTLVKPDGYITIALYGGHDAGQAESAAVHAFVMSLPAEWIATRCARLRSSSPAPELIVIERLR